jgi:hypothetical protein
MHIDLWTWNIRSLTWSLKSGSSEMDIRANYTSWQQCDGGSPGSRADMEITLDSLGNFWVSCCT